jgi:hypothetical protein
VLANVETFESLYGDDPLKAELLEFAAEVKREQDSTDKARQFVHYGDRSTDIMWKYHNNAPGSYKRANAVKRIETAFRLLDVPTTTIKLQEVIALHFLAALLRSTPGEPGKGRTYATDKPGDDFFGANITLTTLRSLLYCIERVSGKDEIDVWDFKKGFESEARDWVKRLRAGQLSRRQVEALIEHHEKVLEEAQVEAEQVHMTEEQRQNVQAFERSKALSAHFDELSVMALEMAEKATKQCKLSASELRDYLANKQLIPPVVFPSIAEIASRLTPGDAKAVLQELVKQGATKPDRQNVLKAFYQYSNEIVRQIKSAHEQTAKAG